MTRRRRAVLLLSLSALTVAGAGPASAWGAASTASAGGIGPQLTVNGLGSVANTIFINWEAGPSELVVSDFAGEVTAGAGCTQDGLKARCPGVLVIVVNGGSGADQLDVEGAEPGYAISNLNGGAGRDSLFGGSDADVLDGGEGDGDLMDGGFGPDEIAGGPGALDELDYSGAEGGPARGAGVTVTVGAGGDDDGNSEDGPAGGRDEVKGDVEFIEGTDFADLLVGDTGAELLQGEGGADRVKGGGGDDAVGGNGGNDRVFGGKGRDQISGSTGIDLLFARDRRRDKEIDCGPGKNRLERARRDRIDPPAKSC